MKPPYSIANSSRFKLTILAEAQNWRCCYCGIRCDWHAALDDQPSREHVVPVVAGGTKEWENEVMACRLCNNGRGAMYARVYLQRVMWRGRKKAAAWAKQKRRESARAAHQDRRGSDAMALHVGDADAPRP